jgi:NADP-dependent 3-hydroxy acid dehydrogenase YdfG
VIVADLNETGANKIVNIDPSNLVFCKANVAAQEAWETLVHVAEEKFGHVDIIVNNAGTSYANKPTLEVTEAEYDMTMDVNVKSIFWSVQVGVPAMLKTGRGGCFVNVASIGATRPRPGLVWYAASKGTVANVSCSSAFPRLHHISLDLCCLSILRLANTCIFVNL